MYLVVSPLGAYTEVTSCAPAPKTIRAMPRPMKNPAAAPMSVTSGLAGTYPRACSRTVKKPPITPVITGDEEKTQAFARRLFEEGVFTPAIVFPTVAKGQARVRTIVTADHTEEDLRTALEVFARVGSELSLR